ncbi:MAG: thioredoxin family protein [Desulfobulbaceae bacterium]|nr:thioredoxin family protein [Desulfobulbaceae bacterium]
MDEYEVLVNVYLSTIKIGNATVGLIGLDSSLQEASGRSLPVQEAVDLIYLQMTGQNYIPTQAETAYRDALKREYLRHIGASEGNKTRGLSIRILGPGCVSCNKLNSMIFDILQRLGVKADIDQIHDLDEIWRHGVQAPQP